MRTERDAKSSLSYNQKKDHKHVYVQSRLSEVSYFVLFSSFFFPPSNVTSLSLTTSFSMRFIYVGDNNHSREFLITLKHRCDVFHVEWSSKSVHKFWKHREFSEFTREAYSFEFLKSREQSVELHMRILDPPVMESDIFSNRLPVSTLVTHCILSTPEISPVLPRSSSFLYFSFFVSRHTYIRSKQPMNLCDSTTIRWKCYTEKSLMQKYFSSQLGESSSFLLFQIYV